MPVLCLNWGMTLLGDAPFFLTIPSVLATTFALGEAARRRSGNLACLMCVAGWIGLLATLGCGLIVVSGFSQTQVWLPALWATLAVLAIPVLRGVSTTIQHGGSISNAAMPNASTSIAMSGCVLTTLCLTVAASMVLFSVPMRVAGLVSLGGLLLLAGLWKQPELRKVALILVNWQLLFGMIPFFAPNLTTLLELTTDTFAPVTIPFALLASLQLLPWQHSRNLAQGNSQNGESSDDLVEPHRVLLRVAVMVSMLCSLGELHNGLTILEIVMACGVFIALSVDTTISAVRRHKTLGDSKSAQDEQFPPGVVHAWVALGMLGLGLAYLAGFGVISLGTGMGKFAVLLLGVLAWGAGRLAAGNASTQVLTAPLATTGMCLPGVAVLMGVIGHWSGSEAVWMGLNSLALLLAGGFYFWRGLEDQRRSLLISSAVIVNVALGLLWDELNWSDPQFFMIPLGATILGLVEMLRGELPERMHNPLRYAGALTTLWVAVGCTC